MYFGPGGILFVPLWAIVALTDMSIVMKIEKSTILSYATFLRTVKNVFWPFCQANSTHIRWNAAESWDSRVPEIEGFWHEICLSHHDGPLSSWRTLWRQPKFTELARFDQSWTAPVVIECKIQRYPREITELAEEVGRRTGVPIKIIEIV